VTEHPELTRDEAIALADDLGQQLYRAEDRIAFVREMLTGRTEPVDPAPVLAWLDHQHCARAESEQEQITRLTAERDQYAELLTEASDALRAVGKAAIVVEPTLSKPYPDAPHTSPWERFMKAPAKRAYNLGWQIRTELTGARRPSDQTTPTTPDDPPTSINTVDLSGHDVRCPSCRKLLGQFVAEPEARTLVADHTC